MKLQINSSDRIVGTPSKFTVNVPFIFEKRHFRLSYASVANNIYNVNAFNNTIVFNEGATRIPVTIPVGYYTYSNLYSAIASAMTAATTIASTYTVTYSTSTLLVTITSTANFTITYSESTLLPYLGYPHTGTSTSALQVSSVLSPQLSPSEIYINLTGFSSSIYSTNNKINATFVVPLNASIGQYNNLDEQELFHQHAEVQKKDTHSITVTVTDKLGNQLTLLSDWTIILTAM